MLDVPNLDYDDPAVCALLRADDAIHDPYAICDYLADASDAWAAARDYATDASLGELSVCDPDLAWSFVADVRRDNPVWYDQANDRIAADCVPAEALDDLDAHVMHVSGVLIEVQAENELLHAVQLLTDAVADGRLTERAAAPPN